MLQLWHLHCRNSYTQFLLIIKLYYLSVILAFHKTNYYSSFFLPRYLFYSIYFLIIGYLWYILSDGNSDLIYYVLMGSSDDEVSFLLNCSRMYSHFDSLKLSCCFIFNRSHNIIITSLKEWPGSYHFMFLFYVFLLRVKLI